ncbi:hypothetical protein AJ79_08414 [Helicocarpus griseus UAMH5409]|uniref:Rhodopsin domain-containing protein n=1 Tax=Helicocarpus griseus UAMH5409 TaxID=1447875 RepID=A0A2B7WT71_9EURO|nr:hypothetical protein AJ79_08414 [Helicocarpus griseus UAMH5409]
MTFNPEGNTILSVTWILGGIATISFFGRIYTRFVFQQNHGWDDYTMIVTWLLAIVSASLASVAVHYGLGMNIDDIKDPFKKINAVKYLTIAPNFSILSVALGKVSIVLLLRRVTGLTANRTHYVVLWLLVFISFCLSIAAVVAVLRFCLPTESIWNKNIQGKCIDPQIQLSVGLTQASFNAFTDLVLALFPTWVFWNLQMKTRRKIGLMLVMGAGIFGAVITSYKAYQLRNLTGHNNLTKSWSPITIWNCAEMFVLIITASVPTVQPLVRSTLGTRSTLQYSYPLKPSTRSKLSGRGGRSTGGGEAGDGDNQDLSIRTKKSSSPYPDSTLNTSVDRILPSETSQKNFEDGNGIIKTADFTITYEEGSARR